MRGCTFLLLAAAALGSPACATRINLNWPTSYAAHKLAAAEEEAASGSGPSIRGKRSRAQAPGSAGALAPELWAPDGRDSRASESLIRRNTSVAAVPTGEAEVAALKLVDAVPHEVPGGEVAASNETVSVRKRHLGNRQQDDTTEGLVLLSFSRTTTPRAAAAQERQPHKAPVLAEEVRTLPSLAAKAGAAVAAGTAGARGEKAAAADVRAAIAAARAEAEREESAGPGADRSGASSTSAGGSTVGSAALLQDARHFEATPLQMAALEEEMEIHAFATVWKRALVMKVSVAVLVMSLAVLVVVYLLPRRMQTTQPPPQGQGQSPPEASGATSPGPGVRGVSGDSSDSGDKPLFGAGAGKAATRY